MLPEPVRGTEFLTEAGYGEPAFRAGDTANSQVHRLLTFETRGRFSLSIAWESLRMAP